jgi:hypothetical protein
MVNLCQAYNKITDYYNIYIIRDALNCYECNKNIVRDNHNFKPDYNNTLHLLKILYDYEKSGRKTYNKNLNNSIEISINKLNNIYEIFVKNKMKYIEVFYKLFINYKYDNFIMFIKERGLLDYIYDNNLISNVIDTYLNKTNYLKNDHFNKKVIIKYLISKENDKFKNIINKYNIKNEDVIKYLKILYLKKNKKYNDEYLVDISKYINDCEWNIEKNFDINYFVECLDICFERNLIKKSFKIKIDKSFLKNDLEKVLYFYYLKGFILSDDDIINLINYGIILNNFESYGIKMNNKILKYILEKDKLELFDVYTFNFELNEENLEKIFLNEKNKTIINYFVENGSKITNKIFNSFLISKNRITNNMHEVINEIIVNNYDLTVDNLKLYEEKNNYDSGIYDVIKSLKEIIEDNTKKLNITKVKFKVDDNECLKLFEEFIEIDNFNLYEYFISYIIDNNLKINEYFITDKKLSKLFNIKKGCLNKITDIEKLIKE